MLEYKDIEITKITPANWFCGQFNLKFTVPIYQRLFTWGNEQFDRLLSDLKEWNGNEPYYLGIITVVKKDDKYILIDGQQRLTVIAILAGMLGWCSDKDPENFLAYEARPADQKALKKIWEFGKTWFGKETGIEHVLGSAGISSDSMKKFIRHIVRNHDAWEGKSNDLWQKLTLLISELPKAYGTGANTNLQNEYFEKMNSAGKQLEPHEILKVRICKQSIDFAAWNRVEDFTKCYTDASQNDESALLDGIALQDVLKNAKKENDTIIIETKGDGESALKKVSIMIGSDNIRMKTSIEKWRPALIDFPMFLLHVLKIVKDVFNVPSDSHNLLKNFEGQLPVDKNRGEFCKVMKDYRKFLDSWIIHREVNDESDDNDSKYAFWNDTKEEVVYLKGDDGQCDSSMTVKKIKQLQMILYALGGQKQEWLYEAYKEAYNEEGWGNLSNRKDQLNGWYKWLRARLIDEADFKYNGEKWCDTYLTYGNVRPVHFMCLDYFLWDLSNETINDSSGLLSKVYGKEIPQAVNNFVPRAHRSVEHFHPQTDDNSQHRGSFADQTDPINNVKGWGATIDNDQTSIKNIFGNLALISAGRNSEYSNMSVAGKSERIEKLVKEGRLESIKLFLMKQACGGHDDQWLPDKAQEHADLMLKVIQWGLGPQEVAESISSAPANEP